MYSFSTFQEFVNALECFFSTVKIVNILFVLFSIKFHYLSTPQNELYS